MNSFLIPPAYAQRPPVGDPNNVYGAIFKLVDANQAMTPGQDDRSLVNYNAGTSQRYVDQAYTFRMQASVPQQLAWAAQSSTLATGMDKNGNATTVDGNPVSDLYDLETELLETKRISNETDLAAQSGHERLHFVIGTRGLAAEEFEHADGRGRMLDGERADRAQPRAARQAESVANFVRTIEGLPSRLA